MSELVWLPTGADGRRWELWRRGGPRERDRDMLGRVFIDLYGDGKTSVGWFITIPSKRGRKEKPRYSWKEEKTNTLRAGAELLIEKVRGEP